jgi:hypothetical protein
LGTPREEVKSPEAVVAARALRSTPRVLARTLLRIAYDTLEASSLRLGACPLRHENCCDATWMTFLPRERSLPATVFSGALPPGPIGLWDPDRYPTDCPGKSLTQAVASAAKLHHWSSEGTKDPHTECRVPVSTRKARVAPGCGNVLHDGCLSLHYSSCVQCHNVQLSPEVGCPTTPDGRAQGHLIVSRPPAGCFSPAGLDLAASVGM